jgi:thioredoxin-dependent peroxiredoxin
MAEITHKGKTIVTAGSLPNVGSQAPEFRLTNTSKQDVSLSDFAGKYVVMNIFPSIDTRVCAVSVRIFNQRASKLSSTVVLCISKDLPFAHTRFCGAEGIENVIPLSQYKDNSFSDAYNVDITENSDLVGLMSRAIVVVNPDGRVVHTEQVSDLSSEPDYNLAISFVR